MKKEKEIKLNTEELWQVLEFVTFQTKKGIINLDEAEKHTLGIFKMLEKSR